MTSVAVVEDHPLYRDGLCQVLEGPPETVLVGAYPSVEHFLEGGQRPDVVLLDLRLPGRAGADAVAAVCSLGCKVMVVSASGGRDDVVDAVGAGAAGYLTKDAEPAEILSATARVAAGETYVSPTLAGYLLGTHETPGPPGTTLSAREREILWLLACGERDQDIAEALFISVRTVRSHLDRIRDKTGQRRRADLTRFAIEHRMAPPEP